MPIASLILADTSQVTVRPRAARQVKVNGLFPTGVRQLGLESAGVFPLRKTAALDSPIIGHGDKAVAQLRSVTAGTALTLRCFQFGEEVGRERGAPRITLVMIIGLFVTLVREPVSI